ncbi:Cathepsin Z [Thelohanellus kitauei]|nr:Cathepsin Z [Thelohanellus kitauei]
MKEFKPWRRHLTTPYRMLQTVLMMIFLIVLSLFLNVNCTLPNCYDHAAERDSDEVPKKQLVDSVEEWTDVPKSFDWRQHVVLSTVKNSQMPNKCQICYAYAAASTIVDRMIVGNVSHGYAHLYPSIQYILDCINAGLCIPGGRTLWVYQEMIKKAVPDWTCNPFRGYETLCEPIYMCYACTVPSDIFKCHVVKKAKEFKIKSYGIVAGELPMMAEIMTNGPISCAITATHLFMNYTGGILFDKYERRANYFVEVIGWGEEHVTDVGVVPYWIAKNSFGTFWGEDGFVRIPRSSYKGDEYTFGIEKDCNFPIV